MLESASASHDCVGRAIWALGVTATLGEDGVALDLGHDAGGTRGGRRCTGGEHESEQSDYCKTFLHHQTPSLDFCGAQRARLRGDGKRRRGNTQCHDHDSPARVRRTDPGEPERCPVWNLHQVYSDAATKEWVLNGCRSAGIGCFVVPRAQFAGWPREHDVLDAGQACSARK